MKYTMVTYDYESNSPICVDRFTANDPTDAYLKARALCSELRHLYYYATVYFNEIQRMDSHDQIEKAHEEHSEIARKLIEAACTGSYVVPNYEYIGYVLYIGDIDDVYDGIYMGGFDMDYDQFYHYGGYDEWINRQ